MIGRYLVDTNILVYAYDRSEPVKQAKSIDILDHLVKDRSGALSPQILSEFFSVVTKKIPAPLTADEAGRLHFALKYICNSLFLKVKFRIDTNFHSNFHFPFVLFVFFVLSM